MSVTSGKGTASVLHAASANTLTTNVSRSGMPKQQKPRNLMMFSDTVFECTRVEKRKGSNRPNGIDCVGGKAYSFESTCQYPCGKLANRSQSTDE